jgi:hypothetical protein
LFDEDDEEEGAPAPAAAATAAAAVDGDTAPAVAALFAAAPVNLLPALFDAARAADAGSGLAASVRSLFVALTPVPPPPPPGSTPRSPAKAPLEDASARPFGVRAEDADDEADEADDGGDAFVYDEWDAGDEVTNIRYTVDSFEHN